MPQHINYNLAITHNSSYPLTHWAPTLLNLLATVYISCEMYDKDHNTVSYFIRYNLIVLQVHNKYWYNMDRCLIVAVFVVEFVVPGTIFFAV